MSGGGGSGDMVGHSKQAREEPKLVTVERRSLVGHCDTGVSSVPDCYTGTAAGRCLMRIRLVTIARHISSGRCLTRIHVDIARRLDTTQIATVVRGIDTCGRVA